MTKQEILEKSKKENGLWNDERDWALRFRGDHHGMLTLTIVWILCTRLLPMTELGKAVTGLMVMSSSLTSYAYQFFKNNRTKTVIGLTILFLFATVFYLALTIFWGLYVPAKGWDQM